MPEKRTNDVGHECARHQARRALGYVATDAASRWGAAREHPRIDVIAGQGGQQPHRRGRQGHRLPSGLSIEKTQLAGVEDDVLPAPLLDLRWPPPNGFPVHPPGSRQESGRAG